MSAANDDELDFQALLERASSGDQRSQALICEFYESKVRIVARVMLGPALRPHLDTMDLVQSVHRSLLIGLRAQRFDISTPEKLIALAAVIVRRKIARNWRRHRRQRRWDASSSASEILAQTLCSLASPDVAPDELAEYNDQLARLCLNLSDDERRMLSMRLEGYTSPEVAHELGIHPVALRVRWTRLRKRLQEAGFQSELL